MENDTIFNDFTHLPMSEIDNSDSDYDGEYDYDDYDSDYYDNYDDESYSWEDSLMDALDGEIDAYWNID